MHASRVFEALVKDLNHAQGLGDNHLNLVKMLVEHVGNP